MNHTSITASVYEQIFGSFEESGREDLRFEDISVGLKYVHAIFARMNVMAMVIGHLPFLAGEQLDLDILALLQSLSPSPLVLSRKLMKPPCTFITTIFYALHFHPLLF